ncbi:MAG: sugar kinase [Thermoguttaceae bacterium]|nr:sugar kinase [Thermoguttaceae bacterium]
MKVVAFGELLLRLAAPGYTKLFQKDNLEATFCGGEANVAASLSIFGLDSVFITKLPDSDIGRAAARSLAYFNVDTSKIVYGDGRLGLYYLEKGASQRPSKVIYDRKYSAISLATQQEFDWDQLLEGANWFHWTGITPALSDALVEICLTACKKAREKGIVVSCDLNYRAKLWSTEQAQLAMNRLMPYVDVCVCNEEDAEKTLGIKNESTNVETGELNYDGYVRTAETIHRRYGCKYVATTLRKSYSESRNGWSALLYDAQTRKNYSSREYDIQIVDRVGGGDSFSAGLIYALGTGMELQKTIDFATAASCLKQTIEGDFNRTSVLEVMTLLKSGGSGRVVR